jgi:MYXO-CTERM domain-containing protein
MLGSSRTGSQSLLCKVVTYLGMTKRWFYLPAVLAIIVVAHAADVAAHIQMSYPAPRTTSQKVGPCGAANSVRGTNVTVLAPGATIVVKWKETINHPGHYRISFDPTGQSFTIPPGFNDLSATKNVLLDNIADNSPNGEYAQTVTLPNTECANCTLQVIQMMTDKPPYGDGNDIYFQCADITLQGGVTPQPDAAPGGQDAAGGSGASGGCQSSSSSQAAGAALALVACLFAARRKRR